MTTFDMPPFEAGFPARGAWLVSHLAADFELQPFQAAGIVGNLGFESGGFVHLQEIHPVSGRGGYGWGQWTGPRRRAFEQWCAENSLRAASDEANFGFLEHELKGDYASTIDRVSNTNTLEEAVFSVGESYERPGGTTASFLPGNPGRLRFAKQALAGVAISPPVVELAPAAVVEPPEAVAVPGVMGHQKAIGGTLAVQSTMLFDKAQALFTGFHLEIDTIMLIASIAVGLVVWKLRHGGTP